MFFKTGNITNNQIKKIEEQPKEGFDNINIAEKHLFILIKNGSYPFDREYDFTILPLYTKKSIKTSLPC